MNTLVTRAIQSSWYLQTSQFTCLNGLRAFSIVAVVWHHTASSNTSFLKLAGYGYHGVTLFFLISGFLITTLLLKEKDRTGKIDLAAFFARRSLRIFPLYYAVLIAYVLLVYFQERNTVVGIAFYNNLKYFVTYTSNVFVPLDGRVIFYFAWSLAAEEQFYLIMAPLIALLNNRKAFFLVAVTAGVLISFSAFDAGTSITLGKLAPLGIWLGTLGAFLLRNARTFNLLNRTLGLKFGPPVLGVTTLWMLETSFGGQLGFVIGAFAFLLSCLISADALTKRVLNQRLLIHIGQVSYGIYLLHMICKALVLKTLGVLNVNASNITVFLLVLGSSTVLATLSYLTFERFFLNFKSRFAR